MTRPNPTSPALRAMLEAERADNLRWNAPSPGVEAAAEGLLAVGLVVVLAVLIGVS